MEDSGGDPRCRSRCKCMVLPAVGADIDMYSCGVGE